MLNSGAAETPVIKEKNKILLTLCVPYKDAAAIVHNVAIFLKER